MSEEDQVYDQRATVVRGTVSAIDDDATLQTVDITTHKGVTRASVEVATPYGFVSVAPPGAIALVAAIGGDPADLMAIAVIHPGARAGKAAPGTVGLVDAGGNRVLILPGGTIEVVAATVANVVVQGTTLQVGPNGVNVIVQGATLAFDAAGVTIPGTLTVGGAIHGTADHALHTP